MKKRYVVIDLPIYDAVQLEKLENEINAYANRGFKVESFHPHLSGGSTFSTTYVTVLMSAEMP